jgi:hypothetical protein
VTYGYDPYRGTEQFYDCDLPTDRTAPITFWMRDRAKFDAVDVAMPEGNIVRSISRDTAALYVERGGVVLPDANRAGSGGNPNSGLAIGDKP